MPVGAFTTRSLQRSFVKEIPCNETFYNCVGHSGRSAEVFIYFAYRADIDRIKILRDDIPFLMKIPYYILIVMTVHYQHYKERYAIIIY